MRLPTELWTVIASHLRRRDLLPMLRVDCTRAQVAEQFIYNEILLRHNREGRLALLKPEVVHALFAYLASPRGERAARRVLTLDAFWNHERGSSDVSTMLCEALVRLGNLQVLRAGTSVDRIKLEVLLAQHSWPALRHVYIDSAEVPRSFLARHPLIEVFRTCFGVKHAGHPRTIGVTCLSTVCVTTYADCTYIFSVQQPSLVRVDVVSNHDMLECLALALNQSPSIRQLNFAWTGRFTIEHVLAQVPLLRRRQIISCGVWIFPISDLASLAGVDTEVTAVMLILQQLDTAFPSLERLSFQYVGVYQDSYKDQMAISRRLAHTVQGLISGSYVSDGVLSSLRHISLGLLVTVHRASGNERFHIQEKSQAVIPDPMYAAW